MGSLGLAVSVNFAEQPTIRVSRKTSERQQARASESKINSTGRLLKKKKHWLHKPKYHDAANGSVSACIFFWYFSLFLSFFIYCQSFTHSSTNSLSRSHSPLRPFFSPKPQFSYAKYVFSHSHSKLIEWNSIKRVAHVARQTTKLTDYDNEKSKIKYQILMMVMPMLMMFSIIYSQKKMAGHSGWHSVRRLKFMDTNYMHSTSYHIIIRGYQQLQQSTTTHTHIHKNSKTHAVLLEPNKKFVSVHSILKWKWWVFCVWTPVCHHQGFYAFAL